MGEKKLGRSVVELPVNGAAMTSEEKAAEDERRAAELKARWNNGAKRRMHFDMDDGKGCLS